MSRSIKHYWLSWPAAAAVIGLDAHLVVNEYTLPIIASPTRDVGP